MCYDDQARPPEPPGKLGAARGDDLVLTAADGNRFAAYYAVPTATATAHVVIYPDVRGLHQFYKELALRFAETGIAALALDYFGRTAGLTSRDESFEFQPHVQQVQLDSFVEDVKAALAYIRERGGEHVPVVALGFCMGGTLTLLTGTRRELGFAGLVAFYPGMSRTFGGQNTALEQAGDIAFPLLALFGGDDAGIPPANIEALERVLTESGREHEIIVYPGAPHSFFDRRAVQFVDESADAWQRVLRFISLHTAPQ